MFINFPTKFQKGRRTRTTSTTTSADDILAVDPAMAAVQTTTPVGMHTAAEQGPVTREKQFVLRKKF